MRQGIFRRALERQQRAWNEAHYRYQRRENKAQKLTEKLGRHRGEAAEKLAEVFTESATFACRLCQRCCSKAAMDSGYFNHNEREMLIAQGIDIGDYVVTKWEEGDEPPERCLFLKSDGCNIPAESRSKACLSYVCEDKLGPRLVQLSLEKSYRKRKAKLGTISNKMAKLGDVPFVASTTSLGDG